MKKLSCLAAVLALGVSAMADDPKSLPPVEKELNEYKRAFEKKVPADLVKTYEEGIELVRKSGVLEKAIKVGDKAPDFELPDATGKTVKLSELTANGPVVLTWYRGGWCPYCNIQLRGMQKLLPEMKAAGATLLALSPEKPDNSLSTAEKNKLEFIVLSDKGNTAARKFGVVYKLPEKVADSFKERIDLAKLNGDDSMELPLAATYVIDAEGKVRYAFIDADYRKRAEPKDVLEAVKKLKK